MKHLQKHKWTYIIIALACLTRLVGLGSYPGGTYTDEAYGAYASYALMTEGICGRGYAFPVYFVAWGAISMVFLYNAIIVMVRFFRSVHLKQQDSMLCRLLPHVKLTSLLPFLAVAQGVCQQEVPHNSYRSFILPVVDMNMRLIMLFVISKKHINYHSFKTT